MDDWVLTSIRRLESLSFFPATTQLVQARGRIVPIPSRLPSRCQCGFSQRREQGVETCVLHKPSIPRSGRKIPPNVKTHFHLSNCSEKAKAIFSGTHCDRPDRQTPTKSSEQPWNRWTNGTMGDWVKQVWHTVSTTYNYKGTSYCWIHRRIHSCGRLGGRREPLMEHPYRRIFQQASRQSWCGTL